MSLLVSIIKSSDSVNVSESNKNFDAQGGTIGRGADNTWVLEDPERYLSSCHCRISQDNGQYFITDMSTNGTFYNGSPNPIGKGAKLPLKDGDSFIVGDYEFSVSSSNSAGVAPLSSGFSSDPFADNNLTSPFTGVDNFVEGMVPKDDPFAASIISSSDSLFSGNEQETDPLAALDKAQGKQGFNADSNNEDLFGSEPSADPFIAAGAAFSDQASPVNQQISWPDAVSEPGTSDVSAIPDDWDDDFNVSATPEPSAPAKSIPLTTPPVIPRPAQKAAEIPLHQTQQPQQEPEVPATPMASSNADENAKIHAELELLKKQISAQQRVSSGDVTVDTSLIDSLGLQNHKLSDAEIVEINQLAGNVMKEMLRGLMQVLGSRGAIKNEFRMHVTTIQPVENNPIKFSANVEDALENMFIKKGNAFKKPVEAVQEGFESVAEHQIAILAGIKAAFKGVIERFDPALLEERFSKQNKAGFIPGIHKAKNWDLYNQYYEELAGDIDNSFHYLFGDDFVRAYEDQLQKMTISKKAKKSMNEKP